MIKTERQLINARTSIAAFEQAIASHKVDSPPPEVDLRMHAATLAAKKLMLHRLQKDVERYEDLKSGNIDAIRVSSLENIPLALIEARIARGLTQRELADRLGVAEQQVQRWEKLDYENTSFENLLAVAEALDFDLAQTLPKELNRQRTKSGRPAPHKSYRHTSAINMPAWPRWQEEAGFDPGTLLRILQTANTFNQAALVQYTYLAGQKHKALKEASQESAPARKLLPLYIDLFRYLNDSFQTTAAHNLRFLKWCFSERDGGPPRICLKGNWKSRRGSHIVSLFRDSDVPYASDVALDANTGFASIAKSGSYFVENDIPDAALRGQYVNPRLDTERILKIYGTHPDTASDALSTEWPLYWRDYTKDAADSNFYRSTLIMPLKLWDTAMGGDFEYLLRERKIDTNIFGYLCMDHPQRRYFNPAFDLNVSKIFADALCSMVLLRLNFTTHSNTIKKLRKLEEIANWEKSDNVAAERVTVGDKMLVSPFFPSVEAKKVHLVNIDDDLLRHLQSRTPA